MMTAQENRNEGKVTVRIDYLPSVNHAMLYNGIEVCNALVVENASECDWRQADIAVGGPYIKECHSRIELLRQGQPLQVRGLRIAPDPQQLSGLTEAVATTFRLSITSGGESLFDAEYPITLLPPDHWAGSSVVPELLSAYVTPDAPCLQRVMQSAAAILEQWTGSADFDEYQTQDRNRVRAQVAAIYEALRSEGIACSAPPADFDTAGQRIRPAGRVLAERACSSLDLSLVMASCLEQVGICPIIIVMKGRAMVGARLIPHVFPQMVCDDASYLLKETADGNNNLVAVEPTAIDATRSAAFEEAVGSATRQLADESSFRYFIDIHRCRLGNIRPLPQGLSGGSAETQPPERPAAEAGAPSERPVRLSHYDLRLDDAGRVATKQMLWERKLLDFSLRNNLLNTRLGRKVVPFISFGIERLEDHLQNGEDYHVTPSPGKRIEPGADGMYDSRLQAAEHQDYVTEMIGGHQIVSYLSDTELQNALKYIYRTARTALEENGANSLFLALGMLKWYETAKSCQPRYAPILLLPVDIVRRSGNNYIIRKRDEDTILNITLVELLKQNFSISLDSLKQLPKDESGVDVKKVLTYLRRAIIGQKRWNVVEEAMLGLFSFNKFVMWNDIHSNADRLQENAVVTALINQGGGSAEESPAPLDARVIDRENSPRDFCVPLDVDSSQMEAIVESGRGQSFILHGPPGTGKSQTITNMIANALYQGRRVLFVAEKMAALSVVQSRLERIGLAPFCLELHSNKATKKHFLEQMDQVLKVTRIKEPEEYARRAEELFSERKELMGYMEALHQKGSGGLSLYECLAGYLAIGETEVTEQLPRQEQITAEYIERCADEAEQTRAILDIVGAPAEHPLYGLDPKDNRQETLDSIRRLTEDYKADHGKYAALLQKLNADTALGLATEADIRWVELFARHIRTTRKREELQERLTASYSADILRLDTGAYRREWEEVKSKWLLPRYFAKRRFLSALQAYGHVFESGVDDLLTLVADYQDSERRQKAQREELETLARANGFSHQERQEAYQRHVSGTAAASEAFAGDAEQLAALDKRLTALLQSLNAVTTAGNSRESIEERLGAWTANYQRMRDWYHWVNKKRELEQMGAGAVVGLIESGRTPAEAMAAFEKGLYHRLIDSAIDESEQLRMFNGLKFRQKIEKYKHDTARFQELCKELLYSRLAARVPAASAATAEGSEISILKRNIANGGRGQSIRGIIDSIPTLLPRLCPCMLMSPISVAQYIDLSAEKFDLVIFDEASQMPTSEAVGAIARGKALIVVGDSRQMPPTNFFNTSQTDEEEADIDDMESILDDCITLSLCEHQLNWHYRSKHESLIAFSNSQYYDNRLLTFPSVDDHVAKVRLVPVEGVYDKGRTRSNPGEAKAIVAEVIRRLADPALSRYSIGVVAFSKVQGDLIEDELMEQLDKQPQLKETALGGGEPLFVKNLENVQGDERDVILFSIGYGADKNGRVSMNFGPLNNAGGERRLNVAVSRARYEMMVFSTLRSGQIDLRRSNAKGVEGLKAFLEFAETGRLPITAGATGATDTSVVAAQIAKALAERGYIAEEAVGRSSFKVDIAVGTREHPERYLLGILCDGRSYYETKTTRDREIVQPGVLRMLNWRVMRVYSLDWYSDRERTLQQILDELRRAEAGPEEEPRGEEAATAAYVFDADKIKSAEITVSPERNSARQPYRECGVGTTPVDKDTFNPLAPKVAQLVRRILTVEQPATEGYLAKRLARVLGFAHAGANVQKAVSQAVSALYQDPMTVGGIRSYWTSKDAAKDYHAYRSPSPRNISEIPAVEIANAIREVIDEEFSLPKDRIPSVAARKLGFASTGAKINEAINAVLLLLEEQGVIAVNNGQVSAGDGY